MHALLLGIEAEQSVHYFWDYFSFLLFSATHFGRDFSPTLLWELRAVFLLLPPARDPALARVKFPSPISPQRKGYCICEVHFQILYLLGLFYSLNSSSSSVFSLA